MRQPRIAFPSLIQDNPWPPSETICPQWSGSLASSEALAGPSVPTDDQRQHTFFRQAAQRSRAIFFELTEVKSGPVRCYQCGSRHWSCHPPATPSGTRREVVAFPRMNAGGSARCTGTVEGLYGWRGWETAAHELAY